MAFKKTKIMKIKNICCIGAGYVGGPTMSVIALKNFQITVTVVDINKDRIDAWNGPLDNLPIFEPGLSDVVKETRGKNLFFSTDIDSAIKKAEMIFISVNTPTKTYGEGKGFASDLTYVEQSARHIGRVANGDKIIVEKSTLPVRTAEKIKEVLEAESRGNKFEVLSNPEFLAEGTAIEDLLNADRVLIGGEQTATGKEAISKLLEIYASWLPKERILTTNVWSSELSKLAANAMLAQRISSINSLSALCEKTGAKIDELSKAIGMDSRIGPKFLKASVGFGGSCFQKDILNLVYLCKFYGLEEVAEYWHQVVKINDYQKERFANNVVNYFGGDLSNIKLTILGWAFKANTNDSRESASIFIAEKLFSFGAIIEIYDPMVSKSKILNDISEYWMLDYDNYKIKRPIKFLKKINQIDKKTNAILILTEWDEFKTLDEKSFIIFDGRKIIGNPTFSIGN